MQNVDRITLEARKAYRFLCEYQKRILDLMSYIEGRFCLKYDGGYSQFSNAGPRNGKGGLDLWSWDWLNMYFYEFHFRGNNNVRLSAFIINDTGFYDALREDESVERLDVDKFESVEDSKTKLIFVAAKNMWDAPAEWGNWQSQMFINQDKLICRNEEDGIMISRIYGLEDFESEVDAARTLHEFSAYCSQFDIPINFAEMEFKK